MALPVVSGRKVVKALTKAGFRVAGRIGSHLKLKRKVDGKVLCFTMFKFSFLIKFVC